VQQPRQRLSFFDPRVDQDCAGHLLSHPVASFFAKAPHTKCRTKAGPDVLDARPSLSWQCFGALQLASTFDGSFTQVDRAVLALVSKMLAASLASISARPPPAPLPPNPK
jgi:hypothetical protein